jgi:phospholipid transport system transporter-binding protein
VARPRTRADAGAPGALAAAGPGRFTLAGEIGFEDAGRLLAEGDAAFAGLASAEVDLANVERFDSAGLALLLEWSLAAREAGRTVRYRNLPSAASTLAGISDVTELLSLEGGG